MPRWTCRSAAGKHRASVRRSTLRRTANSLRAGRRSIDSAALKADAPVEQARVKRGAAAGDRLSERDFIGMRRAAVRAAAEERHFLHADAQMRGRFLPRVHAETAEKIRHADDLRARLLETQQQIPIEREAKFRVDAADLFI